MVICAFFGMRPTMDTASLLSSAQTKDEERSVLAPMFFGVAFPPSSQSYPKHDDLDTASSLSSDEEWGTRRLGTILLWRGFWHRKYKYVPFPRAGVRRSCYLA